MKNLIATVAVEKTYFNFDGDYDYAIPESFINSAQIGSKVSVGFGNGNSVRNGIIIAIREGKTDTALKYISDVVDNEPSFNEELVKLAMWLHERTFCTTYDCLKAMIPRGVGLVNDATIKMVALKILADDVDDLLPNLTEKQKKVVKLLSDVGTAKVSEVCAFAGVTIAVVNKLVNKNIIVLYDQIIYRNPYDGVNGNVLKNEIILTEEQNNAYNSIKEMICSNEANIALLFGVTGSGKTQVFLKAIDDVINNGKNVIVLVPEISLTPQTLNIFHKRYGSCVAVFHSGLSMGERADEFKRVREGKAKIVVGTRSAIFAPLNNIGLIVIDEEQEHTYKSENSPRYHARDVAKFRCAYHNATLLLASATPSIESYSNALNGKYKLCQLTQRYGSSMLPEVVTIDMKNELKSNASNAISQQLYVQLRENIENKHQSILLINRRGYNTFIACNSCGHVITCPNCSISMTYHSSNNKLMCHYCGYQENLKSECPECHSDNVRYSGFGTQRIEEEILSHIPNARILRMDADTTQAKFAHETKLSEFANGDYDILVGTQMVAKGLDFHNVTLVGIVNADNSLYNENYTANERAFSLFTQVVGRSGRGKLLGKAVIQTINPDNPIIELASQQDYKSFYDLEIQMRKILIYPPYCDIFVAGFVGKNENTVALCAKSFFELLVEKNKQIDEKIIVLGPSPAKIAKISNKYRYRLAIKCKNNKAIRNMIKEILIKLSKLKEYKHITMYVDLNCEELS